MIERVERRRPGSNAAFVSAWELARIELIIELGREPNWGEIAEAFAADPLLLFIAGCEETRPTAAALLERRAGLLQIEAPAMVQ